MQKNISELEKEYAALDEEIIQYKEAVLQLVAYNRVPITTLINCLQVCVEEKMEILFLLRQSDTRKDDAN